MKFHLSTVFIIFFLKSYFCCDCNKEDKTDYLAQNYAIREVSNINKMKHINVDKRQLEDEDRFSAEENTETTIPMEVTEEMFSNNTMTVTSEMCEHNDTQMAQSDEIEDILRKCPYYKNGAQFDLRMIADVWQNVYYQINRKLSCFRIHMKIVTEQERKHYEKKYGYLNNNIDWNKCILEIKTGPKKNFENKQHFLHGAASDSGVMRNIIIVEEYKDKITTITLSDESPDQWLLVNNLLLMRDCDDGDIVVFARAPFLPRRKDVLDALIAFGVEEPNGTFGCAGEYYKNHLKLS